MILFDAQSKDDTDNAEDEDEDNHTLLKALFDLIRHLVQRTDAAAEALPTADPTPNSLQVQDDFRASVELSDKIDRVERDGYRGTDAEERKLQRTLNTLLAAYAGDPEVEGRIRIVVAIERDLGFGGVGE